jgi:aminocarboxymuconate-semialdehyde decarboxylase
VRIDIHAHYWPGEYIDALIAAGKPGLGGVAHQPDDFDERVATQDRNDVQLQVLSSIGLDVTLADDEAASVSTTRLINDLNTSAGLRHPGRFAVFGSVPLPFVDAAIAETERCYDELGALGIALPCIVGDKPIDHPDFERFWENLARHDAVVYVHPTGSTSAVHPGLSEWGLNIALGSPVQITAAPIRILYSGLSRRYPSLRFVFAMCAGQLPYLWPRIERNLRRGLAGSAVKAAGAGLMAHVAKLPIDDPDDPLGGLRRFWYDTAIQDVPIALLAARESYGADRLLLGSDEIFASLGDAVEHVQSSTYLSDEQKTAVLDQNAVDLLGGDLDRFLARAGALSAS